MKKFCFFYESNIPFSSEKVTNWLLHPSSLKKAVFPLLKGGIHTSKSVASFPGGSALQDTFTFEIPFYVSRKKIEKQLKNFIERRNQRMEADLKRLARFSFQEPLKVLISGGSGFIGKALTEFLEIAGMEVVNLSRKENIPGSIYWDAETRKAQIEEFEGFDAVFHLAGENLGEGFWTARKKERILESRKKGTEFLVEILSKLKSPPQVFVSASAIGYYGNSLSPVTEESPPGSGFLSKVCLAWETASKPLETFGVRVVHARLGVVISSQGGLLKALLPLFRLSLGSKLGDGKQIMSWIALEDAIGAFYHILGNKSLEGAVNLTSPFAVSQEEFAKEIAKTLSKPCFFSLPRFFFPGEKAAELLFSSIEASPFQLESSGFTFLYPKLEEALKTSLL